jgi:hypothetical protein
MIGDVHPGSRIRIRIFSTPDPGSDPDDFPSRIPVFIRRCHFQNYHNFSLCSNFLTLLAAIKKGRKQKGLESHDSDPYDAFCILHITAFRPP